MNPFRAFTDMELQKLHHAMMEMVYLRELDDPTRKDLLEWAHEELRRRMDEEEELEEEEDPCICIPDEPNTNCPSCY
jgi:hypothetical protein